MRFGRYEKSDKSSVGTAVTFLLIGMGAGALLALLFAPKSGQELRQDIRRKYEDAKDAVEDFADDAKDRVGKAVDRGAEWVDDVKQAARKGMEPLRDAIRNR
jgi:gas vesicle protein